MFGRILNSRGGNVTVEAAFMFLVISATSLGAFELGRIFYEKSHLENVVKAGVQYSLLGQTSASDVTKIVAAATLAAGESADQITITATSACECPGEGPLDCSESCSDDNFPQMLVTVTAERDLDLVFNLPGLTSSRLSAVASVRVR